MGFAFFLLRSGSILQWVRRFIEETERLISTAWICQKHCIVFSLDKVRSFFIFMNYCTDNINVLFKLIMESILLLNNLGN